MLPYTKLYPIKVAGFVPFAQQTGYFYFCKGDDHWLFVESTSKEAAEQELWEKGIWGDYDENALHFGGQLRTLEMMRLAAKRAGLDIFDDGFRDNERSTDRQ
jgi:hypothetical protein